MNEIKKKPQWKKRVELTQFFYSCLIKELNSPQIKQEAMNFNFSENQIKMIYYFANNLAAIKEKIVSLLKKNWTWERLNFVIKAIIYLSYCEFYELKLAKPIVIDQALITCDHYCQNDQKNFLNGLLEQLLK